MAKVKVSNKEFAWYCVGGIFAVLGLALIIFGIIGDHMHVNLDYNFIKSSEAKREEAIKIPFGFRILGIISLALGMLVIIITLNYNAKKVDREVEKTVRRQQRLNAGNGTTIAVKDAVQVLDETPVVEASPAKEEPKAE